jgi:hypothetical protein
VTDALETDEALGAGGWTEVLLVDMELGDGWTGKRPSHWPKLMEFRARRRFDDRGASLYIDTGPWRRGFDRRQVQTTPGKSLPQ